MSVSQRLLLLVAAGAGLVIAVATAVTYGIVYDAARERDLKHLDIYVAERARREELGFQQVQANLRLVRGQFLKRLEAPVAADYLADWDRRFRLFPDGAWRSREEFADGRRYSTLWANRRTQFTPELKKQVMLAQDLCDELLPGWVDTFPSVYFVLPGWLNIGYDPRLATWVWETPADYDPGDLEWFQLAMTQEIPLDRFRWSGVIEEPTTKVPIVSIYLPIVQNGRFLGSVGHDLFVNRLMEETTRSDLPGAMHVIFREDGRLIAHPTKRTEILASIGRLRMQDSGEPALASLYRAVSARTERQFSGFDEGSGMYYSVARLTGPEWVFLTTVPRELLQRQAFASAQWVLWSGLFSLALVLGLLAIVLRRQIALPLAELSRATKQMGELDTSARAVVNRRDEFGELAGAFNEMAGRIAARGAELRQLNQDLEHRVAERTAELRESEQRIRESEARARGLYEGISTAVVVQDENGFLQANPAAMRLMGVTDPRDFIGRRPPDFSAPIQPDGESSVTAAQRHIARALAEGRVQFEWLGRKMDGTLMPLEVTLTTLQLDGRTVIQSVIIDLTERKRAEIELQNALAKERELRELKSDFVALVSHEFRTPLEIIMSSTDNLKRYHERLPAEKRNDLLDTINRAVRRMAGMMEEVLVLGRLETDGMKFRAKPFEFHSFCQRVCDEIESATGRTRAVRGEWAGTPADATGDESLVRHICTNLLSNALKYSPPGQSVDFTVAREGAMAVFRIADRGCGIPAADQKRVFQAFHRGSNVRQIPGTGLGLLIVRRCVELHGGEIGFESTEGQGTTFTVRLPLFG